MTIAAHYLGQPLAHYDRDACLLASDNLAVCEDFELDIVQAISDPYRKASDFGLEMEIVAA